MPDLTITIGTRDFTVACQAVSHPRYRARRLLARHRVRSNTVPRNVPRASLMRSGHWSMRK